MDAFLRIGYLVSAFYGVALFTLSGIAALVGKADVSETYQVIALFFLQAIALKPR